MICVLFFAISGLSALGFPIPPFRPIESIHYNQNKQKNIIFIHSSFSSAESLFDLARDWRVKDVANSWLISMPNHGNSYRASVFSTDSITQEVFKLITTHNLKNVYLVGHSLGANVAMNFAAKFGSLIKGVLSLDFLPFGLSDAELNLIRGLVSGFKTLNLQRTKAAIKPDFLAIFPDPESFRLASDAWKGSEGNYQWTTHLDNYYNNVDNLLKNPIPTATKFYGKFKLVTGLQSLFYKPALFPNLVQYYPNINLQTDIIKLNGGHVLHYQFLDECVKAILSLLA